MRYHRTNKKRDAFVAGITREEAIERCIGNMESEVKALQENELSSGNMPLEDNLQEEMPLGSRYNIATASRHVIPIWTWLEANKQDSAFKVNSFSMIFACY
jgi:hypothetical protein